MIAVLLHRPQETASGSQAPAGATPGSALPLHIPKANSSLQSRATKLASSSQDLHGSSPVVSQPSLIQVSKACYRCVLLQLDNTFDVTVAM